MSNVDNTEVEPHNATEPKMFDEAYVKELRQEAASYRVRAKEVEEQFNAFKREQGNAKIEHTAKQLGVIDSSVIPTLLGDTMESIVNGEVDAEEAISALLESKPYLKQGSVGKPSAPAENTSKSQLFTREEVSKMTPEEVNSNWHIIEKQLQDKSI